MTTVKAPAPRPCETCPYRRDVPSGVWDVEEYEKLPDFDGPTWSQPPSVFICHSQLDRLCAGWVAVHDMTENLGVRIAAATGTLSRETIDALPDYETAVPVFGSGLEAAQHGLRDVEAPSWEAVVATGKLQRRRRRT